MENGGREVDEEGKRKGVKYRWRGEKKGGTVWIGWKVESGEGRRRIEREWVSEEGQG